MMTEKQIRDELENIVIDLGLEDADTHVDINRKWIHVLISTSSFENKSAQERENLIWKEFEKRFDDETILSITQCYLLTPEERKASLGC